MSDDAGAWLVNPIDVATAWSPADDSPRRFHRTIPGYDRTRLVELPSVAAASELRQIWIKDESERFALPAFKILGASWAVARLLSERFETEVQTYSDLLALAKHEPNLELVAATEGNHGRAVARVAKWLGWRARIVLPSAVSASVAHLLNSEGAVVERVNGSYDDAVRRSAEFLGTSSVVISDTAWLGYERVPGWIAEGYSTLFWELEDQLRETNQEMPDAYIVQIGVGSLAAALTKFVRSRSPDAVVLGVEPTGAACVMASVAAGEIITLSVVRDSVMTGLNCGTPSYAAFEVLSQGVNGFMSVPDARATEAQVLLKDLGVTAGLTGAAGLGGLLELTGTPSGRDFLASVGIGDTSRLLLISTEGVAP